MSRQLRSSKASFILSSLIASSVASSLNAAPGTLADQPLFLGSNVQPNIFFLIDDSGSMNWEDLLNKGTDYPAQSYMGNSGLDIPPSGDDIRLKRRLLCRGYNVMAYDPTVQYEAWSGVDSSGAVYPNLSLTTARSNPYNSSATDISDHIYFAWNDKDGDGEYDGPGRISGNAVSDAGTDECGDVSSNSKGVAVNSLPQVGTEANPNSQQNYANWWSYYRKREYVAKRALSLIIKESKVRMGLATLHNNNSVLTLVKDIDDLSLPLNTQAESNKTQLLRNLFRIDSSGGTPLRSNLKKVGRYFANDYSNWGSSPILPADQGGECQQNFSVVMSDGFWNGTSPEVGDQDLDGYSNTLADVAEKYYQMDLMPGYDNIVPPIPDVDENTKQHLVTYTVAFGVNGTLDANPENRESAFSWPEPVRNTPTTIDDMRHAAWNGHGLFLGANDPNQLITSLNNAIRDIDARSGTLAPVAFNTTSLRENSVVYQAQFDSSDWHGSLVAREITESGIDYAAPPIWDAGALLKKEGADKTRNIFTFNGFQGVPFTLDKLNSAQKSDLLHNAPFPSDTAVAAEQAANESYAKNLIKYIKGDHSLEGTTPGTFRKRNGHRLGDIVHSAPTVVGAPNTAYPNYIESETYPYSQFVQDNESRKSVTYIGSNDGMLHAFDNKDGTELFAYIPQAVFSASNGKGLHSLAEQSYRHRYFVDLTAESADAFVNGEWRTYILGGLRGGGKSVFALDVTDPDKLDASSVKWEFSHTDLGHTFSQIQVAKMNNNRWAAIFGNGYNNNNGDGKAKLFIVYLDYDGDSSDFQILSTEVGSIANQDCNDSSSDCNGLSSPELADLNGDGRIDRIYAGDIQGNVWVFDVSSSNNSEWKSAYGLTFAEPLFSACRSATRPCPVEDRQPITTKPAIAYHPSQASESTYPNIMVYFGTGQYLTEGDKDSSLIQSFYGIWDSGRNAFSRAKLQAQVISETTLSGKPVRLISDETATYTDDSTTEFGWYIDLKSSTSDSYSKERVVVNPFAYGDMVFFNTMIPSSDALCSSNAQQQGWLMAVKAINGGEPQFVVVDINQDTLFDEADKVDDKFVAGVGAQGIPTESKLISNKRVTSMSNGSLMFENIQPLGILNPSRMSWTNM